MEVECSRWLCVPKRAGPVRPFTNDGGESDNMIDRRLHLLLASEGPVPFFDEFTAADRIGWKLQRTSAPVKDNA